MSHNSTLFSFFSLSAYFELGLLRYLVFLVLLIFYVWMLLCNALLISVICVNRSLHEPMYLFLCSLFFNGIYGSSTIFPLLLFQILQDIHVVSRGFCYFQTFALHVYGTVELLTLSAMSYDRYVAICSPLQYNTRLNRHKIITFVSFPWFYSCLFGVIMIMLSSSLQLCGNVIHKVYCDNFPIIKLSCSDTTALNVYGLIITTVNILFPLVFILYTYVRILQVCFLGSRQTRQKALSTCVPHITSLVNFGVGAAFEIIQYRFDLSHVPDFVHIFLSLYFFIFQPLLNPFVHGLSVSKIRILCKSLLF